MMRGDIRKEINEEKKRRGREDNENRGEKMSGKLAILIRTEKRKRRSDDKSE